MASRTNKQGITKKKAQQQNKQAEFVEQEDLTIPKRKLELEETKRIRNRRKLHQSQGSTYRFLKRKKSMLGDQTQNRSRRL